MENNFEVPRVEALPQALHSIFRSIREAERIIPGQSIFAERRASSFPLCPRAYHISRRLPKNRRPARKEKFMLDAAALLGTALHLVMQKWFAIMMPQSFYGNWKCLSCGATRKLRYGLQTCKCGKEMLYDEFAIERSRKIPFSGHIDGILRFEGVNYLLDFKGSMQENMRSLKVSGHPKDTHFFQTNAYASAINKGWVQFGDLEHIDKIIILYIERGKAHRLWEPMMVSPSPKLFRDTLEQIKTGRKSLKQMVVPRGFCLSSNDGSSKWCPWKEVCFSPLLEEYLLDKVLPEKKFCLASPSPLESFFKEE